MRLRWCWTEQECWLFKGSKFFNYDCKSTRGGSKVSEAIDQLSIWLKLKLLLANENYQVSFLYFFADDVIHFKGFPLLCCIYGRDSHRKVKISPFMCCNWENWTHFFVFLILYLQEWDERMKRKYHWSTSHGWSPGAGEDNGKTGSEAGWATNLTRRKQNRCEWLIGKADEHFVC